MKSVILSLFAWLMLAGAVHAQAKGSLNIQFNKSILQPGDSLIVTVNYNGSDQKQDLSLATLQLIIENEAGRRSRLRWPVVNGEASGVFYLPEWLPRGKYTLMAALQQRFFEVVGKIQHSKNRTSIEAMLLTKTGDWDEQEVPVSPDGTFSIGNWLFEDNALLAFSGTEDNPRPLDIRISTQLDSSYTPLAVTGRSFFVGNPPQAVRSVLNRTIDAPVADFSEQGILLPAVEVRATTRNAGQRFNEEYVSGLFKSGNERLLSIIDDPSAVGFPNILSYLQGRVAGLQIGPTGVAGWRGSPVSFYLDEVRTSAEQIASIPMSDIALVKAYPPPFIGASGGGGAVAVYTRRGGEADLPGNKQVFKVSGYTPSRIVLDMNKLNM